MVEIGDNVLIFDIETKTFGLPNPEKDKLRLFGCYSYKTNKSYLISNKEEIQKIINAHRFLVGFNIENYDIPILKREGIDVNYKTQIDLYDIFIKRAQGMKIKEGMLKDLLMSYSLDYITKTLGLVNQQEGKKDIDYKIFNKDSWTPEEIQIIKDYTYRDIELTKKLYEWLEEYFEGFRDFMTPEDVERKKYLTVSIAKFCYKVICRSLGWAEEYASETYDNPEDNERIAGGYVAYPAGEEFHNDCYCWDFASLYPHIMIQCNLYGRKKDNTLSDKATWYGNGKWKTEGVYYADELSGIAQLLKKWYQDRLVYKKAGDKREYTLKIILNTIYGILNTPYYMRVYDKVAGGDCTRIGRQWIKFARKTYRDAGYKVIYTDTDSIYIQDPFKDKVKMLQIKDKIISEIKQTVPFPQDTFNMALEAEIKHIFFFRGEDKGEDKEQWDEDDFINKPLHLMKKNYIYVTNDGKLEIKNLGIRKKSNTPLSRKIFWEYLVPQIKQGQIKFSKVYIKNLITELLEKDIKLMLLRKDVGPLSDYKKSPTGLQAQISSKYGEGIHFVIPNTKGIGVGKGKSYCTLDEFNTHNLRIEHIDLDNVWNEIEYFVQQPKKVNIFSFGDKNGSEK